MTRPTFWFCILLSSFAGCKKPAELRSTLQTEPISSSAPKQESGPKLDVCGLLTKEEIEAIQGSPVTDTKSSDATQEIFHVSQCYYSAAESSKSVSLALTEANPSYKGKRSPKDFWNETFGPYNHQKKEGDRSSANERTNEANAKPDREKEEQAAPPQKIEGVGDDAFWVGNRVGGALYVLKNNAILRISVGGADNQETKINKSKALALKALPRL
jgi:hypothetical protein